jgi:hypothetical protein
LGEEFEAAKVQRLFPIPDVAQAKQEQAQVDSTAVKYLKRPKEGPWRKGVMIGDADGISSTIEFRSSAFGEVRAAAFADRARRQQQQFVREVSAIFSANSIDPRPWVRAFNRAEFGIDEHLASSTKYGWTIADENTGSARVGINLDTPADQLLQTMAHELTHVRFADENGEREFIADVTSVADQLQASGELPRLLPRPLFENELSGYYAGWRISSLAGSQNGDGSKGPKQSVYTDGLQLGVRFAGRYEEVNLAPAQVRSLDLAIFGTQFEQ